MSAQPNATPATTKGAKAVKPSLISLPTERNKPKDKVSDYKWLIYGQPGIGKTSLANDFEMPLILDFEGRTKHLECFSMLMSTWSDVQDVFALLKTGNHQFKTIVFDTVDILYRLCVVDLCNKRGIEHPSDESWGKGSDMVKNQIYALIAAFQGLGLGIVFVSHTQTKEIKERGIKYDKTTVSLPGTAASIFLGMSDVVGFCHFDAEKQEDRIITFKGSDYLDAKKSTSVAVQLPDVCPMPKENPLSVIKSYFAGEEK